LALSVPDISAAADGEPVTLVVCAPGFPGSTAEAQPIMDSLAASITESAGLAKGALSAVYFESESAGLDRLRKSDAALAIVPLPFFLEHGEELKLTAKMSVVQKAGNGNVAWNLVAKQGRVKTASSLAKWQLVSLLGYSPRFIRGPLLGGWGKLPESVNITMSGQVLSALRRAANGEDVAVLLDPEAFASMASLPFASDLELVTKSASLPQGLLCTVGKRLGADRWKALAQALPKLRNAPAGTSALDGCHLEGFAPLDEKALAASRQAFAAVADQAR